MTHRTGAIEMTGEKVRTSTLLAAAIACAAGCNAESAPSFGDPDSGDGCQPGSIQDCECDGGGEGTRVCGGDGTWGSCSCGEDTDACGDAVLLVLDRSSSMSSEGKWDALGQALGDALDAYGDAVDVGLVAFPDDTCEGGYQGTQIDKLCRSPDDVAVDISAGAAAEVAQVVGSIGTCGGTPTSGALVAALAAVEARGGGVQVILVTDGAPNCNLALDGSSCECMLDPPNTCDSSPEFCLDVDAAAEAAADLKQAGALVHAIAFCVDPDWAGAMDAIAAAGGTGEARECSGATSLAIALAQIFQSTIDC